MQSHGELLKKLLKRRKLTNNQASEILGFSRQKLNRLFNKEFIDDVTREDIEKKFNVPATYFPTEVQQPTIPLMQDGNCWQQLVAAQAEIIQLQKQIIALTSPSVNAPVGRV